jgi:hypothetical protein
MVNKRLQKFSCRLAVQDQVSWMAFSPETSATRRKWPGHIHRAASVRFAALDTSDSGLGPQAIAPQVPEQVLVPATVPSQTHTDSSVPCTPQTVHRGTVNVGTWNVRGLKVQKHVHKPVDVSLTLTSKDITVCAIKRRLDP